MFPCFAIKIIKSTEAVRHELLPNTPGPHHTLQMCLRAPTQVGSVTQTPIQFMPHEHILPLGHQTQAQINKASDSWSRSFCLTANYGLNGGLQRPCAGSLHVQTRTLLSSNSFTGLYARLCSPLVAMLNKDEFWVKGEQNSQSRHGTCRQARRRLNTGGGAGAAPRPFSRALPQAQCAVLGSVAAIVTSNSEFIYRLQHAAPSRNGPGELPGDGKRIKRLGTNLESQWRENKELYFPLGSILVIKQRLLSYEALMDSLAKWNVNIEAWEGVKINANCLTFHIFFPILPICPNYLPFSWAPWHALSLSLSRAPSVNCDGGH